MTIWKYTLGLIGISDTNTLARADTSLNYSTWPLYIMWSVHKCMLCHQNIWEIWCLVYNTSFLKFFNSWANSKLIEKNSRSNYFLKNYENTKFKLYSSVILTHILQFLHHFCIFFVSLFVLHGGVLAKIL